MVKVGIVGGTGYTGVELLRLLCVHPDVELRCITSRGEAGQHVSDLFPSLRQFIDLTFVEPSSADLSKCDVVFFRHTPWRRDESSPKVAWFRCKDY